MLSVWFWPGQSESIAIPENSNVNTYGTIEVCPCNIATSRSDSSCWLFLFMPKALFWGVPISIYLSCPRRSDLIT